MKGFSIVEVIVVLAIGLILTLIVIVSFSSFRENYEFNNATDNVVTAIQLARSRTLSSYGANQYGVHLASTSVTVFKGTIFSEFSSDNIKTNLPSLIEISSIVLNDGGTNIIFQRITGKTDNYGTTTLKAKANPSKIKTIRIKSTGITDVL